MIQNLEHESAESLESPLLISSKTKSTAAPLPSVETNEQQNVMKHASGIAIIM
jgi:hypothetical protein